MLNLFKTVFCCSLTETIVAVGDNWEYVETPETEQAKEDG
jgi:hypothetical protein